MRNAEAIVAFTFEKTLADVYFGSVLRMIPTFGLQNMNEPSVYARHPHGIARAPGADHGAQGKNLRPAISAL